MKEFIATKATFTSGKAYAGASIGIFDPGKIAESVLGGIRGGQLFAYLFRRFGYPNDGWDDRKELASYLLNTPMCDVFLSVTPYMAGDFEDRLLKDRTRHMFGYCISQEIEEQLYAIPASKHRESEIYQQCNAAFEAAIRDMLRPVFIRDIAINCHGRIEDDALDAMPNEAKRCNEAGYGIPQAFFEDMKRYDKFIDALCKLGGNIENGINKVIAMADKEGKDATTIDQ
jgi:hypothetical protein